MATAPENLTPPELARRWRVGVHRVLAWIQRGELPAWNAATNQLTGRPRYRVRRQDAETFELRRMIVPMPRAAREAATPAETLNWLGVRL